MIFERKKLRRREDKFAQTEKVRSDLAELGLDENGIFLILTEYGFAEHAQLFVVRGGIKQFDSTHFRRIAAIFRVYFASDKYPGVELDDPERVDARKWAAGLQLCTVIVNCIEETELLRECQMARKRQKRSEWNLR